MKEEDKLYLVVRSDLPLGSQGAQICHAAIDFVLSNLELTKLWRDKSNHICLLQVNNEDELHGLILKAKDRKVNYTEFREPDMNNSLTAIAFEPSEQAKKVCSGIKLAFKSPPVKTQRLVVDECGVSK
jgi:hypothetical protein